mmetsp:Transcript_13655/g.37583  ORF Transcript_13655/g.37583 Transcript_13655/m.37583 type:complete len:237 (+) Transcript_13655:176-886(+)
MGLKCPSQHVRVCVAEELHQNRKRRGIQLLFSVRDCGLGRLRPRFLLRLAAVLSHDRDDAIEGAGGNGTRRSFAGREDEPYQCGHRPLVGFHGVVRLREDVENDIHRAVLLVQVREDDMQFLIRGLAGIVMRGERTDRIAKVPQRDLNIRGCAVGRFRIPHVLYQGGEVLCVLLVLVSSVVNAAASAAVVAFIATIIVSMCWWHILTLAFSWCGRLLWRFLSSFASSPCLLGRLRF